MAFLPTIVSVVSFASAALLLGALVASFLRRWRQAAAMSRVVALLGPVVLIASAVGFLALPVVFPAGGSDATAKATALAQGLSETLNCGAVAYLAFLPGALIWAVAHRRLRAGERLR